MRRYPFADTDSLGLDPSQARFVCVFVPHLPLRAPRCRVRGGAWSAWTQGCYAYGFDYGWLVLVVWVSGL